jgi:hypothetical protein
MGLDFTMKQHNAFRFSLWRKHLVSRTLADAKHDDSYDATL